MRKKFTTLAAAGVVALAGIITPVSEAKAGDREDALIGAFVGGLLGSALGNGGLGNGGGNLDLRDFTRGGNNHGILIPRYQNGATGVYLSCQDKINAYETQFERAARDGKIMPNEHNALESIRQTPVSRNRSCNITRSY